MSNLSNGQSLQTIRERDDDCLRYSARIVETGESIVTSALSDDFDAEVSAALAKRGLRES